MRKKNWRIVGAGAFFIILALGFSYFMTSIAAKSTDPVMFMELVGKSAGTVGGIGLVMIAFGLIGKKA